MESYQKYGPALVRKAERILGNRQDALDIVQGVFVTLLEKDTVSLELPFLYRAVTNRSLNELRDRRNRSRLLAKQQEIVAPPRTGRIDDRVLGLDIVGKIAGKLGLETAEMVVYRYLDDMTLDEIEQLTGITRKTVSKRLDKAVRFVKKIEVDR